MPQISAKALLLIAVILLFVLPAAAADVPPGRITVYSAPSGAKACIDNTDCDITPATFAVVGNAWHMIVVTETGYRDWTEVIYVTSDHTSSVTAYLDLDPDATAIRVNVSPGGGTICLDNTQCHEAVGTINASASTFFAGVSPGYHTISVEAPPDYVDTMRLVHVTLGKTTEISITLEAFVAQPTTAPTPVPATGMVRVYVDRTGSTICIDNANCMYNVGGSPGPGTGTTIFDYVTANETHIVTVSAEGYEPFSQAVTVGRDMIEQVDVSLRPVATVPTVLTTTVPTETTAPVATTATPPPTMPTGRSPQGLAPVLGALALCGMVFLLRKHGD